MTDLDTFDLTPLLKSYKNHNKLLEQTLIKLESALKNYSYAGLTPNIIELYLNASFINLPSLNKFLEDNKIAIHVKDLKEYLLKKLSQEEVLTNDESNCLAILLKYDIYSDKEFPIDLVISAISQNQFIINEHAFGYALTLFVKKTMKALNHNKIKNYHPACIIGTENKKNMAEAIGAYTIRISPELINIIYNKSTYGLQALFHELYHIKQYIDIISGKRNKETITNIKEKIIRSICNFESYNYYDNNYEYLSHEIDAEIQGIIYFKRYIKSLGIPINDAWESKMDKEIKELLKNKAHDLRNINGLSSINENTIFFDDLFDTLIMSYPNFLKTYEALTVEYIVEENKVRRKTIAELKRDLSTYKDKETQEYVLSLIKKLEQKEKLKR